MSDVTPRRKQQPIRVWCLPEEKTQIEANARAAGLSVSSYLRNVGMSYKIQGVIDAELVRQLAKVNADQGRLGGLLKLWLMNDDRLGQNAPDQTRRIVLGVLDRIVRLQGALLEVVRRV